MINTHQTHLLYTARGGSDIRGNRYSVAGRFFFFSRSVAERTANRRKYNIRGDKKYRRREFALALNYPKIYRN